MCDIVVVFGGHTRAICTVGHLDKVFGVLMCSFVILPVMYIFNQDCRYNII